MVDFFPGAVLMGLDKDGDPVFVGRMGVIVGACLLRRFGRPEMIQHAIWTKKLVSNGAYVRDYELSQGRHVKPVTSIEDADGLPLLQFAAHRELLSVFGEATQIIQDNYPETVKWGIIIRAPTHFAVIWNTFQHFLIAESGKR